MEHVKRAKREAGATLITTQTLVSSNILVVVEGDGDHNYFNVYCEDYIHLSHRLFFSIECTKHSIETSVNFVSKRPKLSMFLPLVYPLRLNTHIRLLFSQPHVQL